ncbi:MAG TPA: class I SAM-dependent methyltransferase [Chitinophagaceae bacterium]|jgi:SAM-dependent methyltransferase|nr:class I SAM-dependent methyltransferase [Chitinophagaceae bacterium]
MQTKEIQGKLWSSAPADWAKYLEPTFIPMYRAVLNRLNLDEEKMLLDAGCGSGLFLSMASATGAWINGIDAAPGLLALSKNRLPDATLLIEDLEAMPFSDESFDVVTGFNSFQYAGSFENALAEARRVVKKQGKVVIGIWGREEEYEAGIVFKAVASLLPPPGTPAPFDLSEEGKVEAICKTVGLKVIEKQSVFCPWQFSSAEALERGFLCTGPCVKAVQHTSEQKVKQAIIESSQPFNLADDVYYMRNQFTFFITEKI